MTLKEFREIIYGLPDEFDIAIGLDESLEPVCGDTEIIQVEFNDTKEKRMVFVIKPCYCDDEEFEDGEINSQPELN